MARKTFMKPALLWLFSLAFVAALHAETITVTPSAGGGGGSGTVTSVSITSANGFSGTVANPTTTPALTIIAGAITPSSVTIGAGSAITSSGPGGAMASGAYAAAAAGANPSGTAGATAVNGSATTFMRSDGAPAVAKGSNSVFGIVEVDNTTISSATGVISVKPVPLVIGSSTGNVLTAPYGYFECTATCTVTPPVPAAGYQFCIKAYPGDTPTITIGGNTSVFYAKTDQSGFGSSGGTLTSDGSAGAMVCIVGIDSTHYDTPTYVGTWTPS